MAARLFLKKLKVLERGDRNGWRGCVLSAWGWSTAGIRGPQQENMLVNFVAIFRQSWRDDDLSGGIPSGRTFFYSGICIVRGRTPSRRHQVATCQQLTRCQTTGHHARSSWRCSAVCRERRGMSTGVANFTRMPSESCSFASLGLLTFPSTTWKSAIQQSSSRSGAQQVKGAAGGTVGQSGRRVASCC